MNSKFSRLRMKHNARHMFNCTKSTCTYALFEITDYFFTLLWPDVSNYMLNFSLELKNRAWFVGIYLGFHEPLQEEITRGKTTTSWCPFLIAMQGYHSFWKFFVE